MSLISRSLKTFPLKSISSILTSRKMALYPYIFNDMFEQLQRPDIFGQNFGLGIPTSELYHRPHRYLRPIWANYLEPRDTGVSSIVYNKDGFKVNLDVQQFKPDELNVKVVDDFVVVEGKHEERSDEHGYISRHFTRRYKLPKDINSKALESKLSSDGVLELHAPKLALEHANERPVPIVHTNQPALKQQAAPRTDVKEDTKKEKSAAK